MWGIYFFCFLLWCTCIFVLLGYYFISKNVILLIFFSVFFHDVVHEGIKNLLKRFDDADGNNEELYVDKDKRIVEVEKSDNDSEGIMGGFGGFGFGYFQSSQL